MKTIWSTFPFYSSEALSKFSFSKNRLRHLLFSIWSRGTSWARITPFSLELMSKTFISWLISKFEVWGIFKGVYFCRKCLACFIFFDERLVQKFFSFLPFWGSNRFCKGVEESWSMSFNQQRCSQLLQLIRLLHIYILCNRYQRKSEWLLTFWLYTMWLRRNHIIISLRTGCFTFAHMAWIAQNIVYKVV